MSFFNRMMASVGIGNAKVDTRLDNAQLRQGDDVSGTVYIQGGSVEQAVSNIYIQIVTEYIQERDDRKTSHSCILANFKVADAFTIGVNEKKEIPFSFPLPLETPLTVGRHPVWLRTGLDIEMAVDPTDNDFVQVLPHPYTEMVLEAAGSLGFRLKSALCEASRLGRNVPFVQEIEFYPGASYGGRMKELELIFFPRPGALDVLVEVDRRARGVMGFLEAAFEMDERKQMLRLTEADFAQGTRGIASRLAEMIDTHTR